MFSEHATTFAGKDVVEFAAGGSLADPAKNIPSVRMDYDDDENTAANLLREILEQPNADQLTGLVIGMWMGDDFELGPSDLVEMLVASSAQLPNLSAIFVGDILYEECEVSWINQADLSPLLTSFDRLEVLKIRGSQGLSLGNPIQHDQLKSLTIECGGLPSSVVREIGSAELPALSHLELYLGDGNYGWDGTAEDLAGILSGDRFPKLEYLGLRDSEIADEVAQAVAQSPILGRIKELDLSLGTLSDVGAEALLASDAIAKLDKLNLEHHYCSPSVVARLQALPVDVNVDDVKEPDDDYRYVAVGE
ncbi:MAG: STM4015 family protein [Pirellulales bacterium]|nr:STM4015 family protein [Pirellulales bacterium]